MQAMYDYCERCGEMCYRGAGAYTLCGGCKIALMQEEQDASPELNERGRKRVENTAKRGRLLAANKQGGSREQAE